MKKLVRVALLALLTMLAGRLYADVQPVASLANPLDATGASARAIAMASAFVAVADDSTAIFFNPAGLAWMTIPEVAVHHNAWLQGATQDNAVLAWPLDNLGVVAAQLNLLDFGTLQGYDINGAATGTYRAQRLGIGAGWGKEWIKNLAAGVTLKWDNMNIAGESYNSFSGDLGASWKTPVGAVLGLAYRQLGSGVASNSLASSLKVGATDLWRLSPKTEVRVAAATDWQPGGVNHIQIGAETIFLSMLFMRAGYDMSLNDPQIPGLNGLALGLGVNYSRYRFDYAIQPYGELGTSHRLSLAMLFDDPKIVESHVATETVNDPNQAMQNYRKAVEKNPNDGQAWKEMGKIYLQSGHKDYATRCFKEALRLMPTDAEVAQLLKDAGN